MIGCESLAVNSPGAGVCRVAGFALDSRVALAADAPTPIGNTGNGFALEYGVVMGAPVLGNCAADGSGGIVAACKPDEGLFGGGACAATVGKVSVNHDGGPAGSAGGVLLELAGSSPDAETTA